MTDFRGVFYLFCVFTGFEAVKFSISPWEVAILLVDTVAVCKVEEGTPFLRNFIAIGQKIFIITLKSKITVK